jgi:hypothetical protein
VSLQDHPADRQTQPPTGPVLPPAGQSELVENTARDKAYNRGSLNRAEKSLKNAEIDSNTLEGG